MFLQILLMLFSFGSNHGSKLLHVNLLQWSFKLWTLFCFVYGFVYRILHNVLSSLGIDTMTWSGYMLSPQALSFCFWEAHPEHSQVGSCFTRSLQGAANVLQAKPHVFGFSGRCLIFWDGLKPSARVLFLLVSYGWSVTILLHVQMLPVQACGTHLGLPVVSILGANSTGGVHTRSTQALAGLTPPERCWVTCTHRPRVSGLQCEEMWR